LVDINRVGMSIYEKGIRFSSGAEYEFDMIIFALGFDAATGALSELEVRGQWRQSARGLLGGEA